MQPTLPLTICETTEAYLPRELRHCTSIGLCTVLSFAGHTQSLCASNPCRCSGQKSKAGEGVAVGEGRFLLFTADGSRPSDLKKLEETRRAFPGWEHRCCDQQVRPTHRLGLAQAQLERTWAAGAGSGRWESQADRQTELCRGRSSLREAGRGRMLGAAGKPCCQFGWRGKG